MEHIMSMASQWMIELQEFLSGIQYTETLGYVLLTADAILSALFTEMLFKGGRKDKEGVPRRKRRAVIEQPKRGMHLKELFLFLAASIFFFFLNICITLLLLKAFFHFVPQKESFDVLVMRIYESYNTKFVVPLIATIIAGLALKGVNWNKIWARPLLCILLAASAVASSFTFLWDSVRVIQRPHYAPPIESISAIISRRLKIYPFALSETVLRSIGSGAGLTADSEKVQPSGYDSYEREAESYEEPNNFIGYLNAVVNDTYAPGKGKEYLLRAYELYKRGEHDGNHFYIGLMWDELNYYSEVLADEPDITMDECLKRALEHYTKQEEIEKSPPLYWNMAGVYSELGNIGQVRKCMNNALRLIDEEEKELGKSTYEKKDYYSHYIEYIYRWIGQEQPLILMNDVDMVLESVDDLSMYILYGAYAISENRDVMKAYERLVKADVRYQGKSIMVKILRCICADLLSLDETAQLHKIYQADLSNGLTSEEELYLIRYLFATDRFDELWGYIDGVGTEEVTEFSVEKTAIKAVWYFDSRSGLYQNGNDVENLLYSVDEKLEHDDLKAEERNLLLLSRSLLRSRLGGMEDVNEEEYDSEEMLDIEYIFAATNAFNNEKYDRAIQYCERFFEEENTIQQDSKNDTIPLRKLTPQEEVTFRYYMQLILAHAHYECAQRCRRGSDEWRNHIEIAEKECTAFEQSSKSFAYIEEKFEELRGIIHQEKGDWPADSEDKLIIEDA